MNGNSGEATESRLTMKEPQLVYIVYEVDEWRHTTHYGVFLTLEKARNKIMMLNIVGFIEEWELEGIHLTTHCFGKIRK